MQTKQKARLLLGTVLVLAFVGSAFALKAKRNAIIYCSTTANVLGAEKLRWTITLTGGTLSYCTIDPDLGVVLTRITADA